MNKYQEALNEMYAVLNDSERFCKHKDLLQELVDKATPKKPDKNQECECGVRLVRSIDKYCRICGQKIDWSVINEQVQK